jgi:hypothetical protein
MRASQRVELLGKLEFSGEFQFPTAAVYLVNSEHSGVKNIILS